MEIDLNIASYTKMVVFSLIAGPQGVSSFSGIKINLSRKKSRHVSHNMIHAFIRLVLDYYMHTHINKEKMIFFVLDMAWC